LRGVGVGFVRFEPTALRKRGTYRVGLTSSYLLY
jgi:hypothetical protein